MLRNLIVVSMTVEKTRTGKPCFTKSHSVIGISVNYNVSGTFSGDPANNHSTFNSLLS
jgi:hypothetical protein